MARLHRFIAKIGRSPWSAVSGILTFVLSLWGLWEMFQKISISLGKTLAMGAVITIAIGVLLPFAIGTILQRGLRRFSFPAEERFLFTQIARTWRIETDGSAVVETKGNYLFFREPQEEDLFDIAFSSEDYDLEFYGLHSPDATARDREKLDENLWKVFWRSKEEIEIAKPYLHDFTASFPSPGPDFTSKSFTIKVSALTMRYDLDIESAIPVWRSYVYKKRWWQRLRSPGQIVRTAQRVKRNNAPPLTKLTDNKLSLSLRNIERADTYYVVLLFRERAIAAEQQRGTDEDRASVSHETTPETDRTRR